MNTQTVSVSALIRRINRKLATQGEKVCVAAPDSRLHQNVGRYYVVDDRNTVKETHIDLVSKAKDLNSIAEWEQLAAA